MMDDVDIVIVWLIAACGVFIFAAVGYVAIFGTH